MNTLVNGILGRPRASCAEDTADGASPAPTPAATNPSTSPASHKLLPTEAATPASAPSSPFLQPKSRSFQLRHQWSGKRLGVEPGTAAAPDGSTRQATGATAPAGQGQHQQQGPLILATCSVFPPIEHTQGDYCEMFLAR